MSAGEQFRRVRDRAASATLRAGQAVKITKGPFAGLAACVHKNDVGGRWLVTLDGLGDKLYVILTEDALEIDSSGDGD